MTLNSGFSDLCLLSAGITDPPLQAHQICPSFHYVTVEPAGLTRGGGSSWLVILKPWQHHQVIQPGLLSPKPGRLLVRMSTIWGVQKNKCSFTKVAFLKVTTKQQFQSEELKWQESVSPFSKDFVHTSRFTCSSVQTASVIGTPVGLIHSSFILIDHDF